MKSAKKLLILLLVSLLAFSTFVISASAYPEPTSLLGADINLEVGTYSGSVFTPLPAGTELHTNDIITVRIAPTTEFLCGISRYVVMFTKTYFEVQGSGKAAFTPNTANAFYTSTVSDYSGMTTQFPQANWPAALVADGSYAANSTVAVANAASSSSPNGGFPTHIPGDWLFRFNLRVKTDVTVGSGAKVWMDTRWFRTPTYSAGQAYFYKCLDSEKLSSNGSWSYNYNIDLSGANINLEPAAEVNITFDANGGTGGTGPTVMTPGDPLTAPTVTKEGYVLGGWLPELPATVPLVNTTYVAQWVRTFVVCTKTPGGMVVNIQGWTAASKYQIWSYQQVTGDIMLDYTSTEANQWILSMAYAPGSSGDVQLDGSINFTVPNFVSPTENYVIAVRIADAGNNFIQEIRDAYTPEDVSEVVITKVLVDGMVTTGYELKETKSGSETELEIVCNNLPGITYTAVAVAGSLEIPLEVGAQPYKYRWDLDGVAPGIYTVKLTAANGVTTAIDYVTFEVFSLATNIDYGTIDDMTVTYNEGVVNIDPIYANGTFSYRLREPNCAPIAGGIQYSTPGPFQETFSAPGVYVVSGFVTRAGIIGTEGSFDDGIVRTLVIPRPGSGGSAAMTFTADKNLADIAKGTLVTFTAQATGLPGPIQYSFWRHDATGYVLVKDWSTSNTLDWIPARIGEYTLEARAKGAGAGSFEAKRTLVANITDTEEEIAAVTNITFNTAELNANAQPKKPILLKANATATNGDDLLYKFMIYDDDMRGSVLREYSVNPTCVWTPREAGNYTITVMVKNDESFGRYDVSSFFDIFVEN